MKLSEFKNHLLTTPQLSFMLPEGILIASHFHVTEIGLLTRKFVDCGGVMRNEQKINFQIWVASDVEHLLSPSKLLSIITAYETDIDTQDLEIEFEYQTETINKYGLTFNNGYFVFTNTLTACLAPNACGVAQIQPVTLNTNLSCAPNSGCCG